MKLKLIALTLILCIFITGCTSNSDYNVAGKDFTQIMDDATDTTVNLYMWGGSTTINDYIDKIIAPRVKENYKVTLNRVPITDARDIVNQLLSEKQASKNSGSIDLFWLNGENFSIAKENDLMWTDLRPHLPNYSLLVDGDSDVLNNDFGTPTEGLEIPWGRAQFIYAYNSKFIKQAPTTLNELIEWINNNPGKFTYPAPPDFAGSAFLRQVLINHQSFDDFTAENLTQDEFNKLGQGSMEILNAISPNLWREGSTYPESQARLDQLYENEEVYFTMSYNAFHVASKISAGEFPETTKTLVLNSGTLSNTHYLTIPFNAPNKAGALVVLNELLSAQSQYEKALPSNWGDMTVLSLDQLDDNYRNMFNSIDYGIGAPTLEELGNNQLPELPSIYVDFMETLWNEQISK